MKSKILKLVIAILALIGIVGFWMVASAEKNTAEMTSAVNFIVDFAVFLLLALVVITVILSLWSLIKNPAALKKTLIGLIILGIVFAVSYFLASNNEVFNSNGVSLLKAGDKSKWSGAGLNFSLILLAFGGVLFVWDLIKSLIKS